MSNNRTIPEVTAARAAPALNLRANSAIDIRQQQQVVSSDLTERLDMLQGNLEGLAEYVIEKFTDIQTNNGSTSGNGKTRKRSNKHLNVNMIFLMIF